ncbi:ATP-dependent helicase HrpA [Silvimonas terrae]|uniref:ATP-dependent helicase HrpA n=1 Tax=Silvimonas terrae TaxID=300266 RepID=A0A840R893_9NEIS|nr:ATP-dependent RNA helicase HrpA [Silvimonas terrae]MBB5189559.1 ATP-dependent helicase HrpA [Silvimonas terrae]
MSTDLLAQLGEELQHCLARDRIGLQPKLRAAQQRAAQGKPVDRSLIELTQQIQASSRKYQQREQNLPRPTFDDALPVNQKRDDIREAIAANQVVIICGETGSGKTTQLPKICLELGRGKSGLIGHTQPRRLAARTVATRIAQELNSETGAVVGYKVRFADKTSEASYIKLMTDGILLAETLSDPLLSAYDTILIDEAHERSLNIDFLLGYLKQLLPQRPDLKVIVTSATIDADRFANHFTGAPVIEVSGRTYPVEVRYRPLQARDEDDAEIEMEEAIVNAVEELWRHDGTGDVLVFLPGEREIRETAEEFRKAKVRDAEVLPLLARLSNEEQQRIFRSSNGRRVVLATNVAETSLTVPGIRYVIDSGQARVNRYSPRAKVEQLLVEKISQASARQRAGRCGRVSSGICVRLYDEDDFNNRPAFTDPEIVRSSLAAVILRMAALKLGKVDDFPFLEAPSGRLVADGYQQLRELGAVDEEDRLTPVGRQLSRLPVDPKLGRMLLGGHQENCLKEILVIASAMSLQDPRERPFDARDAADRAQQRFVDEKSDFQSYLKLWHFFEEALANKQSNRQLVNLCHEHFLSYMRLREWRDLHRQLTDIAEDMEWRLNDKPGTYEQIHKALLTGLLGNIGMKQPEADEYLGARGIKFQIFPGSGLKRARPKWILAGDLVETTKLFGRCVAAIEPDWVEKLALHLVSRQYFDPHWEKEPAQVVASERVTLYGLPIVARRRVNYGRINPVEAREIFIREALVRFNFNTKAKFQEHNFDVLTEIEELEHKARRQDFLVDEEVLYAFFDQIIPPGIVNGAGFEAWRKEAEIANPKLLFLDREELMQRAAGMVTAEQFPTHFKLAEARLPLSYRFEPGHVLDGITLTLPLHQLNRVNAHVFDWLVPGMLREKITLLIKALPKSIRRLCVPVPDFVTRMLTELDSGADREAPLLPQLARAATRGIGQPVSEDDFASVELPLHLQMNFRVVDDASQELASGRDLVAIRAQLGEAAQMTFREAGGSGDEGGNEIEKTGINKWDFGDLPAKLTFKRQGRNTTGYPALVVDEPESCAILLFDTEHAAEAAHREGVVHLLRIELKEHVKQLQKSVPNFQQLALQLRSIGNADMLLDDLVNCICNRAFLGEDDAPRTKKAFDEQKSRARARLPSVRDAAIRALTEVVAEYGPVAQIANKPGQISHELKDQLNKLVFNGFMAATPWEQLPRLPVYLKAIKLRVDKRTANPARDAQRAAEVLDFEGKWRAEIEKWQRDGRDTAKLLPVRWMIEEWRISLFAQELRTPYPISLKRLSKLWEELLRR